jgi:hypothetical protein
MQFEGAHITEQGVTFGIISVKPHVLNNPNDQTGMRAFGTQVFGRVPIVLMAQDSRGVATFQGRPDLVRFLARIDLSRIPWKKYTVSQAA